MSRYPFYSCTSILTVSQVSVGLAGIVVLKALAQRPNFYSAAVYLSQSSANLMILTNFVFVIACAFLLALQKLLYGPLRPIEVEQLYEKGWFAVTETCLAMTIFRGEVGPWFLIMFFALLAGKVWGWIGEGRVEVLEQQPPRNPRLFHTRLAASLGLSIFFDLTMLEYVINQVTKMPKPDMMVMFGFEFAVLSLLSLSTASRYAINLFEIGIVREQKKKRGEEMRKERMDKAKKDLQDAERPAPPSPETEIRETVGDRLTVDAAKEALRRAELPVDDNEIEVEGWEGKGRWIFYLDLATDFIKLVLYLSFFIILLVFYGLPIHIMRDVFLTCRSFIKRISDFIKYKRATSDMNARYPDATADEIGSEDVCIICREEMRPYQPPAEGQQQPPNPVAERMRPKKLPCGHILHFACLRSWLERQQVCPTCRRSVVPTQQGANGTGQNGHGAAGNGQHPPGDRPIARVFQLGPLRIGVGAARGEHMIEELQREMAENRGGDAGRRRDQLHQYQFGIRWDGRRRHRRREERTTREQLDALENQMFQDINTLNRESRELAILRNAQNQLDILRRGTANGPPPTDDSPAAAMLRAAAEAEEATRQLRNVRAQAPFPLAGPAAPTSSHALQPIPGEQVIQAGSENLPAGLTLPEGWSMMPLRPVAGTANPMGMPMSVSDATTAVPTPPGFPQMRQRMQTFSYEMPVPDHVRAMFTGMPGQPGVPQPHIPQMAQTPQNPQSQGQQGAQAPQAPSAPQASLATRLQQLQAQHGLPVTPAPVAQQWSTQPQPQPPQTQQLHPQPQSQDWIHEPGQPVGPGPDLDPNYARRTLEVGFSTDLDSEGAAHWWRRSEDNANAPAAAAATGAASGDEVWSQHVTEHAMNGQAPAVAPTEVELAPPGSTPTSTFPPAQPESQPVVSLPMWGSEPSTSTGESVPRQNGNGSVVPPAPGETTALGPSQTTGAETEGKDQDKGKQPKVEDSIEDAD
jgi:E3 ubiquitin-protein ligase synoviolin